MGIAENIDALLVKFDISQEALARAAGVTPGSVTGWRKGATPRRDAVARLCERFGLSEDDILSDRYGLAAKEHGAVPGAVEPRPASAYVPLLGRVHAGEAQEPTVLDDSIPAPLEVVEAHPGSYFLQVEGGCMNRVYPEGCYILIDPAAVPRNGSIAVVSIDGGDYVMRRMYRGATTLVLSPESWEDGHEDIVIGANDGHIVEFHGCVVWFQASEELQ